MGISGGAIGWWAASLEEAAAVSGGALSFLFLASLVGADVALCVLFVMCAVLWACRSMDPIRRDALLMRARSLAERLSGSVCRTVALHVAGNEARDTLYASLLVSTCIVCLLQNENGGWIVDGPIGAVAFITCSTAVFFVARTIQRLLTAWMAPYIARTVHRVVAPFARGARLDAWASKHAGIVFDVAAAATGLPPDEIVVAATPL